MSEHTSYCGFVTIVGRTNVGKSTLLNQLVGQKVSITSRKPQTTQHCIIGIHTEGPYQAIYIDTPGLHIAEKLAISRFKNYLTKRLLSNIGLVIFVVEGTYWTSDDNLLINKLHDIRYPVVLVINKVDNLIHKEKLLPHMQFISQQMSFCDIVPVCAKNGMNVKTLTGVVHRTLPKAMHYFPRNYITDCSRHFIASEIIREKLMRFLGDELPYCVSIEIEHFITNNHGDYNINGLILVEHYGQKKIVIGKNGSKIKTISTEARQDMETTFKKHINLELWVKIKPA